MEKSDVAWPCGFCDRLAHWYVFYPGRISFFLTSLEDKIEVVDPCNTVFVHDDSPNYRQSRLFLECLLRHTPPTDGELYIGHKAAIDLVPYQLDPAFLALRELRQRILMADAVGLGKTIECGILLSELIRRGRGKRIMVLTMKSMLTQFQKELWARFSIPLVRLDSVGIQKVRNRIPANENPFYYYDKIIISIDTLKQESEYRVFLEDKEVHWDVIVIDEAHNVAVRSNQSMRAKLAKLLADKSDSLIMLSATPHDGKRQSFASRRCLPALPAHAISTGSPKTFVTPSRPSSLHAVLRPV